MKKPVQTSHDGSFLFLFGIACIGMFAYAIWYKFHTQISYVLLKTTWLLLKPFESLPFGDNITSWRNELAAYANCSERLTFMELITVLNESSYLFVAIPALLTLWAITKVMKHPANRTKRQINPQKLHSILAKDASAVIPLLYYGDLLNSDPEAHKSAMTPEEWIKKHGIIINTELNREKTARMLAKQLGERVASVD